MAICNAQGYCLAESRVAALKFLAFPGDAGTNNSSKRKLMQSYLGVALFFSNFVVSYSSITAPLYDMTKDGFSWDENTWTVKYRDIFEVHKTTLSNCIKIHYPDYSLTWCVRTDASQLGIGGILFQRRPVEGKDDILEPIGVCSHKFSTPATKWITIVQECFSIFHTVKHFQYFLRCKPFVLETDHANLLWMEKSTNSMVMRMHQYLSAFNFALLHIPGRLNLVADGISRLFPQASAPMQQAAALLVCNIMSVESLAPDVAILDNIDKVHGGRAGHHGVKRTWNALNKFFPGHPHTIVDVANFIQECWVCQKNGEGRIPSIAPARRNLPFRDARHVLAFDTVEMPVDSDGHRYILVVYNLFTKFVTLYPCKDKSAKTTATFMLKHAADDGTTNIMHSDPGSDFTSELVQNLNRLLGVTQSFTIVNNPQADGVEPIIKEVIRHLRNLVMDERVKEHWSNPAHLAFVQLTLNSTPHHDSQLTPFQVKFGLQDAEYCGLPNLSTTTGMGEYVARHTALLEHIRALHKSYMDAQIAKRSDPPDRVYNFYKPGDFVLRFTCKFDRKDKLSPRKEGPYEVLEHVPGSNTVKVRHPISGAIFPLNCKDLTIFTGSKEEAFEAAQRDDDQYVIEAVLGYKGDIDKRQSCTFLTKFADGTLVWKDFTADLTETIAFETFCMRNGFTSTFLRTLAVLKRLKKETPRLIKEEYAESEFYLNLRFFGTTFYDKLPDEKFPDKYTTDYVCHAKFLRFSTAAHLLIQFQVSFSRKAFYLDNWQIGLYASHATLYSTDHLITDDQIKALPTF